MHLIVFANPLENDFATSVNLPLTRAQIEDVIAYLESLSR